MLKLRVWASSLELDYQLASGCPAWLSSELELRTLQLATARCRWALARDLERVVSQASEPEDPCSVAVPVRRSAILAATDALLELAAALTDPGCNNVRGIALASCLLRDPLSALYIVTDESLDDAASAATAALRSAT